MKALIDIGMLAIGLIGACTLLMINIAWPELPTETREIFRGGNKGAQFCAVAITIGVVGMTVMLFNFFTISARKNYKKIKLFMIIGFLGVLILLGSMN